MSNSLIKGRSNGFSSNFSNPNELIQAPMSGDLNFLFNQHKISNIITSTAKRKKQIIFGARAMNKQLPLFFQRPTHDYDIIDKTPRKSANEMQNRLDQEVAGGRDEFFAKPAEHKGTYKVRHQGRDGIKNTEDDIQVVDFTSINAPPSVLIEGVNYQTIPSIIEGKKKTLKDPESSFRHEKDRSDIERIELSRILRGF